VTNIEDKMNDAGELLEIIEQFNLDYGFFPWGYGIFLRNLPDGQVVFTWDRLLGAEKLHIDWAYFRNSISTHNPPNRISMRWPSQKQLLEDFLEEVVVKKMLKH